MDTIEALEAAPAPACALLNHLPPETRLNIYKMAFDGSKVHAVLTMEDEPSGGKHHLVRFRHSAHFNLLRSCRKIYDEALRTYWSETALHLIQLFVIADSPERSCQWLEDVHYTPDDYSYHLCSSLPEVVKTNVRHVRGMLLPPLGGRTVKFHPQRTAEALLSNFKSLATCDIEPTVFCHPEIEDFEIADHPDDDFEGNTENNTESNAGNVGNGQTGPLACGFGRFIVYLRDVRHEPKDFLRTVYGIKAAAEVTFLFKAEVVPFIDSVSGPQNPYPSVKRFWNISNGTSYGVGRGRIPDEQGYKMVMRQKFDSVEESGASIGLGESEVQV